MKKVLIGLAVAAMTVVGASGPASAGGWDPESNTIFEALYLNESGGTDEDRMEDLLRDAGLDDKFDSCGAPLYTVFFPVGGLAVLDGLAGSLGYVDIEAALENAGALVKGLLAYHVVAGVYDYDSLDAGLFTNLTNSVGGSLTVSQDSSDNPLVDGESIVYSLAACNGVVHFLYSADGFGVLSPPSAPGAPSCGANVVGGCTSGSSGSGSGLPKTGSESMALTYAALASLIAGAGVLVIRRRSIA